MDEVAPNAEHESIATSLEVEQLDKNLFVGIIDAEAFECDVFF
jgi:hypothetical protein